MRNGLKGALAAAWVVGAAQGVSAADIPAKAPAYKAPAAVGASNWTGFYVGVNAGGVLGSSGRNLLLDSGYPVTAAEAAALLRQANETINNIPGWIVGGQLGYNRQIQNVVVGIEADINHLGFKKTRGPDQVVGLAAGNFLTQSVDVRWLTTVRARAGVTVGSWLWYATAGFAGAQVKFNDTLKFAGAAQPAVADKSDFALGWTAGGGLEVLLGGNWSLKGEYLYADLGKLSTRSNVPGVATANATHEADAKLHVARVGVNRKFGM